MARVQDDRHAGDAARGRGPPTARDKYGTEADEYRDQDGA
ncbi:MAG: hypothetical protein JWL98_1753 [Xanthomonadaceae bacterium]|jgi:hypothetical protein|nr:hypothetical protein [Xanthomonadaceae bacterium]